VENLEGISPRENQRGKAPVENLEGISPTENQRGKAPVETYLRMPGISCSHGMPGSGGKGGSKQTACSGNASRKDTLLRDPHSLLARCPCHTSGKIAGRPV
jgi:hypothetical protein